MEGEKPDVEITGDESIELAIRLCIQSYPEADEHVFAVTDAFGLITCQVDLGGELGVWKVEPREKDGRRVEARVTRLERAEFRGGRGMRGRGLQKN